MRHIFISLFLLILVACDGNQIQTTSGESYLAKYNTPSQNIPQNMTFQDQLRQVASVEPKLTFPARIGLARIDAGNLSYIPSDEMVAWQALHSKLGSEFGEFIPVNPLVAKMVSANLKSPDQQGFDTISVIRLGAARQHLDAVLIYESYSNTDQTNNLLSIANLTIIGGYLLPSEETTTQAYASALLIDVMQAYPYATVNATIDKETAYGSSWGWGSDKRGAIEHSTRTKAVYKLTAEIEKMVQNLRYKVLQKQLKTSKSQ